MVAAIEGADTGLCPFAEQWPIRTVEFFRTRTEPTIFTVEHVTDGNDSRLYLRDTDNQSSVHFLIGRYNGKVTLIQFMSIHLAAWANGTTSGVNTPDMPPEIQDLIRRGVNINMATISIEHERKWPYSTAWDPEIIALSIRLNRWLMSVVSTLRAVRGRVIGHYQIDVTRRANCPGGPGGKLFPFAQIIEGMKAGDPIAEPPPDNRTGIEIFHDSTGGLIEYGPPIQVDPSSRVVEKTLVLLEGGDPFQVAIYQKGCIVWRKDLGASRYNVGSWLWDSLAKLGRL